MTQESNKVREPFPRVSLYDLEWSLKDAKTNPKKDKKEALRSSKIKIDKGKRRNPQTGEVKSVQLEAQQRVRFPEPNQTYVSSPIRVKREGVVYYFFNFHAEAGVDAEVAPKINIDGVELAWVREGLLDSGLATVHFRVRKGTEAGWSPSSLTLMDSTRSKSSPTLLAEFDYDQLTFSLYLKNTPLIEGESVVFPETPKPFIAVRTSAADGDPPQLRFLSIQGSKPDWLQFAPRGRLARGEDSSEAIEARLRGVDRKNASRRADLLEEASVLTDIYVQKRKKIKKQKADSNDNNQK